MHDRLEIYRTFVGTITASEARRQQASTAYLGMVAAIATVSVAVPDMPLILPVVGIFFVALIWLATVVYFRRLAQAKFAVIKEIEKGMDIQAFAFEWHHFNHQRGIFTPSLTRIEMFPPCVIAFCCVALFIYWFMCH